MKEVIAKRGERQSYEYPSEDFWLGVLFLSHISNHSDWSPKLVIMVIQYDGYIIFLIYRGLVVLQGANLHLHNDTINVF